MALSLVNNLLTGIVSLQSNLTQVATNGASVLGTELASQLPPFLTNNPLPNGFPWDTRTANNCDPYTDPPNTGVIRTYDFQIHRMTIAPDGVEKQALVVNGAFPGPLIEANWGDTIQVTIHNEIDNPPEGTSIHWHGLLQKATPWYDGVPSVQQCPIAPGQSFTYSFIADLYGTSWWHSHYSAQYAGGLHGPMVIHGPQNVPYDIDLGPIFLTDYYHTEYFKLVEAISGTDPEAATLAVYSDNNLINGKMDFNCSVITDGTPCVDGAGLATFNFTSGKTHRLRLINAGAEGMQFFSIDDHILTVIANDFVPIQPYDTTLVTLGVGQRTDVLVKAIGRPTDTYWMRSNLTTVCSLTNGSDALAVIYYEDADPTTRPTSAAQPIPHPLTCENDPLEITVPFYPITPTPDPDFTQVINITGEVNATGHFNFLMNNQTFRGNYDYPLLLLESEGNVSYPMDPQWNVFDFGENQTIRIILNNQFQAPHPFHLHGQNMFVLDAGFGEWDGTITNPHNPQRRDVQMVPARGYMVVQLVSDNPGVWPFHCHIAWHVSQGLYSNIMQRPQEVRQMQIPQVMAQTCDDWHEYSSNNVVDEIDSGLKT
ncbi:MAG: hypothetical protein M1838_001147 [Thelocarpon superellum]|nr:MAG: hypothetical protein M1838_001147 [Thelocarpon superellum]